jgi:phage N-6-adenine-methyltransferase
VTTGQINSRCRGNARQTWATPWHLIDALNRVARRGRTIDLDVCAEAWSAKAPRWYGPGSTLAQDGLHADWSAHGTTAWCNPPYALIDPWISKALEQADRGVVVRLLVPPRTDRSWYHLLVEHLDDWAHRTVLERRVAFTPPDGVRASSAPGPVELWTVGPDADLPTLLRWDPTRPREVAS